MVQGIDEFVQRIMPYYREKLTDLVRIQSISQEPGHDQELLTVVEAVAGIARDIGFTAHVVTGKSPSPALIARLEVNPGAPWLIVYNHLDVQPVNPEEWKTKPFEPIDEGNYLIARGATDDKGPMLAGLLQFKHLLDTKQLGVNVELVYETQEENGSGGFEDVLRFGLDSGILTVPDSVLASDTIFDGDNSALTYALRGLITGTISLQTADQVVHSGIGGGKIANPLNILLTALARCYNISTGEATFPGVEEGITLPTGRAREEFERVASAFDRDAFVRDLGARETYASRDAADFLDGLWHKPTFEVHDVRRKGEKGTKIPYQAEADFTMRLAGKQDPARVIEYLTTHLKRTHPALELKVGHIFHPMATPIDNPFMDAAAAACEAGYGSRPSYVAAGGSIGAFSAIQKLFPHAPAVLLAMSKASDGYHAPNEKFEWAQARMGMKAIAQYVASIGELRTR